MILGIGIDIVELKRIEKAVANNKRFIQRILTEQEQFIYNRLSSSHRKTEFLSGRFAAKEAFVKAMGTGIGTAYSFLDIEIIGNQTGKPVLSAQDCKATIHVSISHSKEYAVAQVIIEE